MKILFLILLILILFIVPVNATNWMDADWNNRRNLTINYSMVSSSQTNFPVMVDITQFGLNTDGNDTRITDSSGNQVAREIECYNSTSGQLVFFFNGNSISNTADTSFWMYYNNSEASEPAADSAYGSQAVYEATHDAVYHMNGLADSTSNGRTCTIVGAVTQSEGEHGKEYDFQGSTDYMHASTGITAFPFTIMNRMKLDTVSSYMPFIYLNDASDSAAYYGVRADAASPNNYRIDARGNGIGEVTSSTTLDVSTSEYVTIHAVYASATDRKLYINGAVEATSTGSVTFDSDVDKFLVGQTRMTSPITNTLDGVVSEARSSSVARSDHYISTNHNNLNNPTATGTAPFFISFGEEESYEEEPPVLNGTFLYPNSTYSIGYYGKLVSELVYETGINMSDIGSFNLLTAGDMETLSKDDTNYIQSIDKTAANDGYMYGNFSLPGVKSINFINVKTVHNRNGTSPVILGLFNVSTQKWHAVNNSSVEIVDVEMTYNITGTDIAKYTTLIDNILNLSVSLNTNGDGNENVFVDFVEVYIDYEEVPCPSLECVYNLVVLNQNNISILQNDVDDLKNNMNNLYLFVLLCAVFLVATLRKRGNQ